MFSSGVETRLGELKKDNPIIYALNYIKSHNINGSEILLPSLSETYLDEGCNEISEYLFEHDDSIGVLTNNPNFRIDYLWLIDKYGITCSVPPIVKKQYKRAPQFTNMGRIEITGALNSCTPKIKIEEDDLESGLVLDEPFNAKFIKLLNESGKSNVEVYTKGGISRQVFSNILSKKDIIPKKETVICLIIGMELNYVDGINLLASAGYTLSKSIVFDVVVNKYLKRRIYDLDIINAELDERGCSLLGWKPRNN
jgi:hypothetical protein